VSEPSRPRRALLAIVAVGLLLRVYPWFLPHAFLGVLEQDDGVYYGAAKLLLHGQLPYRDVTIIHPPGSAVLLTPFAAIGDLLGDQIGMAFARLAIAAVAVLNILLVHRLAARLPGSSSRIALAAAALYAVMPNAVIAEHTVLLEPLVNLACLLAMLVLTERPRAAVAAGALLALAVSIKLFAAAYVVVLVAWLLLRRQPRQVGWLAAGLTAGAAVMLLPFFLAAPHAFWQDVVVTQASRPDGGGHAGRLVDLAGFGPLPLALGIPLLVVTVLAIATRLRGASSPPYRVWVGVLLLAALAFTSSSSYFPHYAAFLAPALAIALAGTARSVLAVVLVAFLAGSLVSDAGARGEGDLGTVAMLVPKGSCVFAEHASVAIAADVFAPPTPDCPGWLDGRGLLYSRSTDWPRGRSFYYEGFTTNDRWQAELRDQLEHADFLLIKRPPAQIPEWSATTRSYVSSHFEELAAYPGKDHARTQLWGRR
jgi:alpha-1,2-mannosyltransferase